MSISKKLDLRKTLTTQKEKILAHYKFLKDDKSDVRPKPKEVHIKKVIIIKQIQDFKPMLRCQNEYYDGKGKGISFV